MTTDTLQQLMERKDALIAQLQELKDDIFNPLVPQIVQALMQVNREIAARLEADQLARLTALRTEQERNLENAIRILDVDAAVHIRLLLAEIESAIEEVDGATD